jgi:hypothetical protein
MRLYSYEVTGNYYFPADMLRYDQCWPTRQEDVTYLAEHLEKSTTFGLTSVQKPTVGRWESFGWSVGKVTTRYG